VSTTHRSKTTGLAVTSFFGGGGRGMMVEICGLISNDDGPCVVGVSIEQARELVKLLLRAIDERWEG
jgi:hypothetical protein